jgi:hypothetical protein
LPKEKEQAKMIHKAPHRKLKIDLSKINEKTPG